jgi:predicted dehydrogenase
MRGAVRRTNVVLGTQVGFGIVGLGQISRGHIKGLQNAEPWARLVAVCDTDSARVEQIAEELGAKGYTSYREMIADADVAAICAPVPHNVHYEVAEAALLAGKHILLEKPMAPTTQECAKLIELATRQGLTISVAENTPFVAAYVAVQDLVRSGAIGTPRLIRTLIYGSEIERLNDVSSWKGRIAGTIGGAIFDAGPHSFYLLKWLFGPIDSVQAIVNKIVPVSEVEDNAVVSGRMASGAVFRTEYTFTAEIPWGERLEIYGSNGSIIVDQLLDPPAVYYRGKDDYVGTPITDTVASSHPVEYDPQNWKLNSITAGVTEFARAIAERRAPPVDPADGLYGIKVVESSYASVQQGGVAVSVG